MDCPNDNPRYKLISKTDIVPISIYNKSWHRLSHAIDKCNNLRNDFILYIVKEKKTKIIY